VIPRFLTRGAAFKRKLTSTMTINKNWKSLIEN
jgi:hypothetical protein